MNASQSVDHLTFYYKDGQFAANGMAFPDLHTLEQGCRSLKISGRDGKPLRFKQPVAGTFNAFNRFKQQSKRSSKASVTGIDNNDNSNSNSNSNSNNSSSSKAGSAAALPVPHHPSQQAGNGSLGAPVLTPPPTLPPTAARKRRNEQRE